MCEERSRPIELFSHHKNRQAKKNPHYLADISVCLISEKFCLNSEKANLILKIKRESLSERHTFMYLKKAVWKDMNYLYIYISYIIIHSAAPLGSAFSYQTKRTAAARAFLHPGAAQCYAAGPRSQSAQGVPKFPVL